MEYQKIQFVELIQGIIEEETILIILFVKILRLKQITVLIVGLKLVLMQQGV